MGKSTNLYNKYKIFNEKEQKLDIFLNRDEIKKIEKINKSFIKKIMISFSNLIRGDVKLNFNIIKINSYTNDDRKLRYLYSNSIKIKPFEKTSFIFFSSNLLSVFTDFLFGGNGDSKYNIDIKKEITYTENFINQKIIKSIIDAYCESCKEIFYLNIEFIEFNIIDLNKHILYKNDIFITNYFNFSLNSINVFFSILIPLSIIKKKDQKKINSLETNICSKNITSKKNIIIKDSSNIILDICIKLIISPISKNQLDSLSEGDIFIIKNPEKIIGFIEKKPIFLGKHKVFNGKSVVFLEKFIEEN